MEQQGKTRHPTNKGEGERQSTKDCGILSRGLSDTCDEPHKLHCSEVMLKERNKRQGEFKIKLHLNFQLRSS